MSGLLLGMVLSAIIIIIIIIIIICGIQIAFMWMVRLSVRLSAFRTWDPIKKNYMKFVLVVLLNCADLFQLCLKEDKRRMKNYTFFSWESFKRNSLVSNGAKIFRTNRPEKKDTHIALWDNFFLNPTIVATIKQKVILRSVVL